LKAKPFPIVVQSVAGKQAIKQTGKKKKKKEDEEEEEDRRRAPPFLLYMYLVPYILMYSLPYITALYLFYSGIVATVCYGFLDRIHTVLSVLLTRRNTGALSVYLRFWMLRQKKHERFPHRSFVHETALPIVSSWAPETRRKKFQMIETMNRNHVDHRVMHIRVL
jgi:hypothetical protein